MSKALRTVVTAGLRTLEAERIEGAKDDR